MIIWASQRRDEAGAKDEQVRSRGSQLPQTGRVVGSSPRQKAVMCLLGRGSGCWQRRQATRITVIEFVPAVGSRCEGDQSHPRCRCVGGARRILRLARSCLPLVQTPMASDGGGGGGLDGVAA